MKITKSTKNAVKKSAPAAKSPVSRESKSMVASAVTREVVRSSTKGAARSASTVIEAKIDVGFGNQLFLRGQGSGLSWDRGIPLECVDSKTWRLTFPAQEKLLFKLLLNDSVWAKGEDVVVTPGQRVEITPAF